MSKDFSLFSNRRRRTSRFRGLSRLTYLGNPSVVAFISKIPHTPDSLSERVNRIMDSLRRERMRGDMPTKVDLYFLRFKNANFSWDMSDVIDEVWSEDSNLTFDERIEFIYKITTWDDFKFDVDCSDMDFFSALIYAMRVTSCKEGTLPFLIENIHKMNYPSKLTAAQDLAIFDEAKECLEHLMNNSIEWEIVQQAKLSLRAICKRSYPDELYKVNFNVADRADPQTKPDLERARNIRFVAIDKIENVN